MGPVAPVERRQEHLPLLYARPIHLSFALLVMGALALGGAFWPLSPLTPVARWFAVSGMLIGLGLLLLVLPQRPWTMPVTLWTALVGAGVLTGSCLTSEGVVVVALGVIAAAQFAVYAFPPQLAWTSAGFALAVVALGMVVAPAPFHLVTWVVVVVVTAASTTLLAYVMRWLRRYATTDDLTGALSRGAVLQRLDEELAEARRTGTTLAVVSADVDHFKAINDTRGHLAGDEVLTALVDGWKALLGPLDVVGRTGGDEFVLLLPGRDREAATRWVEGARAASVAPWSAGLALSCTSDTARDLLDRADVALYAQKAAR
jgi:diguanylate cyclase (GGDEF)-like protein